MAEKTPLDWNKPSYFGGKEASKVSSVPGARDSVEAKEANRLGGGKKEASVPSSVQEAGDRFGVKRTNPLDGEGEEASRSFVDAQDRVLNDKESCENRSEKEFAFRRSFYKLRQYMGLKRAGGSVEAGRTNQLGGGSESSVPETSDSVKAEGANKSDGGIKEASTGGSSSSDTTFDLENWPVLAKNTSKSGKKHKLPANKQGSSSERPNNGNAQGRSSPGFEHLSIWDYIRYRYKYGRMEEDKPSDSKGKQIAEEESPVPEAGDCFEAERSNLLVGTGDQEASQGLAVADEPTQEPRIPPEHQPPNPECPFGGAYYDMWGHSLFGISIRDLWNLK